MDKVFRSKLTLKNPHFSERKMGCAEPAAQPSAVQAGRRPSRERRVAALTARGGRRGTGQGVALSVSLCGLGRATTELVTFFSSVEVIRPQLLDRNARPERVGEQSSPRSYAEDGDRACCAGPSTGYQEAGLVPQSVVIEASYGS